MTDCLECVNILLIIEVEVIVTVIHAWTRLYYIIIPSLSIKCKCAASCLLRTCTRLLLCSAQDVSIVLSGNVPCGHEPVFPGQTVVRNNVQRWKCLP